MKPLKGFKLPTVKIAKSALRAFRSGHWVQGSPLPPAAQAIHSRRYD